jgi:hypothetical protein
MLDNNIEQWCKETTLKRDKKVQNMLNRYLFKHGVDDDLERFLKFRLTPGEINEFEERTNDNT